VRGACVVPGCDTGAKMATSRLCWNHYARWRRAGDYDIPKRPSFWSRVDCSGGVDGCWTWLGSLCSAGYGNLTRPKETRERYAHRVAYEKTHGPIPAGMTVDHMCHNTLCCNPKHLQLLTRAQNSARKIGRGPNQPKPGDCQHDRGCHCRWNARAVRKRAEARAVQAEKKRKHLRTMIES